MKKTYITLLLAAMAVCTFAAAPNGSGTYYQNANGKTGSALKTALCGIIYNRTEQTYTSLWTAFYSTDVRPGGENKLWDMYSNKTPYLTLGTNQDTGSGNAEGQYYNREHSFPQSWFGGENKAPMYTDLHHIYPTDKFVNGKRANYPFGETNGNTYQSANGFSKLGACTYPGYTGTVFEPADEYKGDFARTYFYMVTCYEEKLLDWVTNYGGDTDVDEVLDGNTYPGLTSWQLNMLMAWATADPVSEKEINRNNAVYGIQGNRNPFIDYPGLEQYIWGSKQNDAFSYDSYVQPDGSSSGSGGDPTPGGEDVVEVLNVTGWSGYTTNSYSAAGTDRTGTGATTGVSYAMQVFNGSTGAVRGNQTDSSGNFNCRNTTTYAGYYIKEVKLEISGAGTLDGSTANRSVVYFGSSQFSVPPTGTSLSSNENDSGRKKLTWTNTDTSKNYFILYNLKTSGSNSSATVTITWGACAPPSPAASDLALTGAPVALSFDLYSNASAQTVSYTTSGTGAVTVSGGEGYVTTSVDASSKTITVTPTAVTPSAQTITVSQAADATHEAGSVTFTVSVADSTPASSPSSWGWVQTDITALTSSDVFVIVGTNSSGSYAMTNDGGSGTSGSAPAAVAVTVADGKITSTVESNMKWNISTSSSAGGNIYTFYPNGSTTTWLYCLSTNNGVRVGTTNTSNANKFKILDDYIYNVGQSRYIGIYNSQDWRCYTTINDNIKNQTFAFYKYVVPPFQTVAVGDTGYATMVAEADLEIPSGVEVYAVQVNASTTVANLLPIASAIPAGEPVVVKAGEGSYNFVYASEPAAAVAANDLQAASTDVTSDGTQYCLADFTFGVGFYQVGSGIVIPAGKAYLEIPGDGSGSVKLFYGFEEEDPTGIGLTPDTSLRCEEDFYDLSGRKMGKGRLPKGIYIVNGNKYLK